MNEPLKGKILWTNYITVEEGEDNANLDVIAPADVKSAVEWLKESLSNYWGKALSIKDIQKTTDLINQAFEDVTKSNKEEK